MLRPLIQFFSVVLIAAKVWMALAELEQCLMGKLIAVVISWADSLEASCCVVGDKSADCVCPRFGHCGKIRHGKGTCRCGK